ncbi:MAG: hypothetical protein QM692_05170 [Thermomicrobiales bacterium]
MLLDTALLSGGNVYVCPGRYKPSAAFGFQIGLETHLYGAGSGADPATATILDQQEAVGTLVLFVPGSVPVTLSGIRVTGGTGSLGGSGGVMSNSLLPMVVDRCAIVDNVGHVTGGFYHYGQLTMTDSLVSGNSATDGVGGIHVQPGDPTAATVIRSTTVSNNTGVDVGGIRFYDTDAAQTFTVEATCQVIDNISLQMAAPIAGGIGRAGLTAAVMTAAGTTVTGNTNPQCVGVTGC